MALSREDKREVEQIGLKMLDTFIRNFQRKLQTASEIREVERALQPIILQALQETRNDYNRQRIEPEF